MKKRNTVFILSLVLLLCTSFGETRVDRAGAEATHILIGKIMRVDSYFGVNDWGDELIFSDVSVKVEKKIKGKMGEELSFVVEGGAVGDLALKVSEFPLFREGDKFKLYLKKDRNRFKYSDGEDLGEEEAFKKPGGSPGQGKPDKGGRCCKVFAHWPTSSVIYYINPANADVSPNCAANDIVAGAQDWNLASGIELIWGGSTNAAQVRQNFYNEIFFSPETNGNAIAVTYTWYYLGSGEIIEFDMKFYDGAWDFFSNQCGLDSCLGGFYIQAIAVHEWGHAIGLDHNRCKSSIMYPYANYCEIGSLSPDDVACVLNLYGAAN